MWWTCPCAVQNRLDMEPASRVKCRGRQERDCDWWEQSLIATLANAACVVRPRRKVGDAIVHE
jgi:hypothetical protein